MNLKEMVGIKAASLIENGMFVGLGTGSTSYYMIEELGRRVREEGLEIIGVPTSSESERHALRLGIPLKPINDVPFIDITIDGVDEFNDNLNGIKGGGGALLFEKIVANMSKKVIWIADELKYVKTLGKFPLPIEVIPFGSQALFVELALKGYRPKWRMKNDEKFRTDSNNYIIDLHLEKINDPYALAKELKHMIGIVEHGLFLDMTDTILVSYRDRIETLNK